MVSCLVTHKTDLELVSKISLMLVWFVISIFETDFLPFWSPKRRKVKCQKFRYFVYALHEPVVSLLVWVPLATCGLFLTPNNNYEGHHHKYNLLGGRDAGDNMVVASLIPRLEKQKEGLVIGNISMVWYSEWHFLSHGTRVMHDVFYTWDSNFRMV